MRLTHGLLGALLVVVLGSPAAAAAAARTAAEPLPQERTPAAAAPCTATSWVVGHRAQDLATHRPLVGVRPDLHSGTTAGDRSCEDRLNLLCATTSTMPEPALGRVVRPRYLLPWSGTRVVVVGKVAPADLPSRAAADARCASGLGAGWRMATTREAGTGSGWFAEGVGLRVWVRIDDQAANPWDTRTGRALTFTPWKDFERDLVLSGVDGRSDPYRGDTAVTTALPVLCIRKDGRAAPQPPLPFSDRYSQWAGGEVASTTQRIRGTALTSQARADAICAAQHGPGWRMAEFHDGWGWSFWADGDLGRVWVAAPDAGTAPWDAPAGP